MGAGPPGVGRGPAAYPLRLVAGFESTYAPIPDVDCFESTGHDERWREDLAQLAGYAPFVSGWPWTDPPPG